MKLHKLGILCAAAGALLFASSAHAATIVWSGAAVGNDNWTDGGNWVGGTPPADTDYTDEALFNSGSPVTVNVPTTRLVRQLTLASTGWTIDGSVLRLKTVSATASGLNTISNQIQTAPGGSRSWNVSSGGTLYFDSGGSLYIAGVSLSLSGGGSVISESAIQGYGAARELHLNDINLTLNSSSIFNNSDGTLFFDSADALLTIDASIAAVEGMVSGGTIVNTTGLGFEYTDLGGGFTQLALVPEPATGALILGGLGTMFAMARRRRR